LGSFWDPNLASFSVKFRPKTVLGPVSHRKRRFPRNSTKTNRKSIKMPPGHAPKRTKIDPRRSQEATFSLLNCDLVLGSILMAVWRPKCLPLGTLLATKIGQKNDQKFDCSKCRFKIATRPPKSAPGPPQERPKNCHDHPKTTQELPQRPPRPPKMPSRTPRSPQDSPRCSQETQKSPQATVTYLLAGCLCVMHV